MGVKLTIDNQLVEVKRGSTILEAAKSAGIHIPTLCYLKELNEIGYCRVCVVEVEGSKDLVSACNTEVKKGMVVKTKNKPVIDARKDTLGLLANNHHFDCWSCPKEDNCEFYDLLKENKVDYEAYGPGGPRNDFTTLGNSISQYHGKCVLCKRCIAVCNQVVTAKVFKFRDEDPLNPIVSPTPGLSFEEGGCIGCGQCVQVCPTGTLFETSHIDRVEEALANPEKFVVVQTAPAVRSAIGEEFGYPVGTPVKDIEGKMYRALKMLGFDEVTDVNFAADLTIMEEGTEFIDRLKNDGPFPLFTSCSPGWISYLEMYKPNYIENVSTAKSPHMMQGATIKHFYAPEKLGKKKEDVFVVSVMPCTSKKNEAERPEMETDGIRDVDAVLTTRELAKLIKKNNIEFRYLEDYKPEGPLAVFSGAATIFGTTGGVMEAALRTVVEVLENRTLEKVEFDFVRGMKEIKESTVKIDGKNINIAVVHGGAAIKKFFDHMRTSKKKYHFVEIMGCPGGCVNGGGQPYVLPTLAEKDDVLELRAKSLYDQDSEMSLRKSHENPSVKMVYDEFFQKPGSHKAHELLHTHYSQKQFRKE